MDIKIDKVSDTKRNLEITIPVAEMEPYLEKATNELAKNMNIKGFRPGNAPRDVVENSVGKEKLWEEAAREAIQESYPKIIEENNLFTVAQPNVEILPINPGEDVKYKAEVYVMPEFKLPDYKKIAENTVKKEKKEIKVEEKELDDMLQRIRESRASTRKVDREAKEGDKVTFSFTGFFEGDDSKKIEEKDFQVTLGRGELETFKGFEENILGMKEGEEKEFSIELPTGEEKKGKINFNVQMGPVMEREVPELNEEFASSLPDIETVEQLKEKVKEGLEAEKKSKETERVKMKVMEEIRNKAPFEVPEVLIDKELENMIEHLKKQVADQGISFEEYLGNIKKTEEDLKKEWREKAEENVAYAILLHKIGMEENIEVSDEEIEAEVEKHFQASGKNKEEENEENLQRMRAYIHDVMKNRKVFQTLSLKG